MSQSSEAEDSIEKKHKELCTQLNMDPEATAQSWKNFEAVRQKYTLDGDPIHWLSCALYVACRKSLVPTVGLSGAAVEGNCVSLTKLLRLCNINLTQFFNDIKKWIEMASMPEDFRQRVERLERNFTVSSILFQKFKPIFLDLFVPLENVEPVKPTKGNKKLKMTPCTVNSVFEFCWCLFVCVKGEFPMLSDDLVNMFHVLLSCLDLVYVNAVMDKRKDLLNTKFKGLPEDWTSPNYEPPEQPPCIVDTLCELYPGIYKEAKVMKLYAWRDVVVNFFQKSILKGNETNFTGLIQVPNFDYNLKSLNTVYETYVLSVGEFDERIFLGHQTNGIKGGMDVNKPSCSSAFPTPNIRSLVDDTPLTGRKHLKKGDVHMTPVTSTTHSVQRLHLYLQGHGAQPSATLQALCRECKENPIDGVINRQKSLGEQFIAAYSPLSSESIARNRLDQIVTLYYKLLEHIIREEIRKKPTIDVQALLGQGVFHQTLFVCCVEIVIHAYKSQVSRFPWVLECFNVTAFSFYKIIELVVLAIKEKLTRDVVKHLNAIEEHVLEILIWASGSPLWDAINKLGEPIPTWSDVRAVEAPAPVPSTTPVTTQAVRRTHVTSQGSSVPQSPVSSATERFVSPTTDLARQLFKDSNSIKPGQSLLNNNNQVNANASTSANNVAPSKKTPRFGSLGLFFRKFYSLAVVRMKDLCKNLELTDDELIQKIWTCLEYSITHVTHLMKDRHLDQILMCAIYITCKVLGRENGSVNRTFTEIMKCYRQQPQATPHVYRSVLISRDPIETNDENQDDPARAPVPCTPPSPGRPACHSVRHATQVRGDLIFFYNKVYVEYLKGFSLGFSTGSKPCPLSPLPPRDRTSAGTQGPWRVSEDHNVYVRPLSASPHQAFPVAAFFTYKFSRSPSKDLQTINRAVAQEARETVLKRPAPSRQDEAAAGGPTDKKVPCMAVRKLHDFIPDQQATQ